MSGTRERVIVMFNSYLIELAKKLSNGSFSDNDLLVRSCYEFYYNIILSEIESWESQYATDEGFITIFADDFPPGFLRRDLVQAKSILFDLLDIAKSRVIRGQLSPVMTYVLYNLVRDYFDVKADMESDTIPDNVLKYLDEKQIEDEDKEDIIGWFSDFNSWEIDFEDTYNGDYVSAEFAENIASIYLYNEFADAILNQLGVTIDEFFDLLPNDLRLLCVEKFANRKNKLNDNESIVTKNETDRPTVFISYSWDNEQHKIWVSALADRLASEGIITILDQNDLRLGDPMPHFMEQSIDRSNFVLIICTPIYKKKADSRKGGVGYEDTIITGDLLQSQNHRKYIPVLAAGCWKQSVPLWASGKLGVDLSTQPFDESEFEKLVKTIKNVKASKKSVKPVI